MLTMLGMTAGVNVEGKLQKYKVDIDILKQTPNQQSEQCVIFHLFFNQFRPNSGYVYINISVINWYQQIKSTSKTIPGKQHCKDGGNKFHEILEISVLGVTAVCIYDS